MTNDWTKQYGLIDWKAQLMTPAQILAKCETEEGRKEVANYIMQARIAFCLQNIMEHLAVTPPAKVQQECCEMLWDGLFRVPTDAVMEYARQVAEGLAKMQEESVQGNC